MTLTDSTPMTASASVPRLTTERQPSGTPIRSAAASAVRPRISVFGSASITSVETGRFDHTS